MGKIKVKKKTGIEVYKTSDSGAIYKRVIAAKGRKPKKVHRIEMTLPKVTMVYFSDSDLVRLGEIEKEISESIPTKKGKISGIINAIGSLLVE